MNTLVLDDEPRYREHVKRALEKKGIHIHAVGDAEAARSVVQELGIDLLIVDIRLAGEMDGLDFAEWVRQQKGDAALIVITGYGSPEHEERSRDLGAIAYLEKPFSLHDLAGHVQRVIDRHELLREIQRLEQELAAARETTAAYAELSRLALVGLADDGRVLHATPAGARVLATVVDPALPRPVARIDGDLQRRICRSEASEMPWQQQVVFARDGSLRYFSACVHQTAAEVPRWTAVFFESGVPDGGMDPLWMGILSRALSKAAEQG